MTLQELKYVVAVARERHFGRAARACHVSQPALSAAVAKLEDELGLQLFDRTTAEITVTPAGREVIAQAQVVLEASARLLELATANRDPLLIPLHVGLIHTICPYLLPHWVPEIHALAPQLPLHLQEGLTAELLEKLHTGELDVAVLAEPIAVVGVETQPLYAEPLVAAAPLGHPWTQARAVTSAMLAAENVLLLTPGNCFRDQILRACPDLNREAQGLSAQTGTLRGSSLTTIRHMVLAGVGVTVLPATSLGKADTEQLVLRPLEPVQHRRVVLAWRRGFSRPQVLPVLTKALHGALARMPTAIPS